MRRWRFFGASASVTSDIYELAVTLFAMLTGRLPWESADDPDARLNPARPSQYDRDHALPWYSYVIIAVENGRATDTASWIFRDDRSSFQEEEIESPGMHEV